MRRQWRRRRRAVTCWQGRLSTRGSSPAGDTELLPLRRGNTSVVARARARRIGYGKKTQSQSTRRNNKTLAPAASIDVSHPSRVVRVYKCVCVCVFIKCLRVCDFFFVSVCCRGSYSELIAVSACGTRAFLENTTTDAVRARHVVARCVYIIIIIIIIIYLHIVICCCVATTFVIYYYYYYCNYQYFVREKIFTRHVAGRRDEMFISYAADPANVVLAVKNFRKLWLYPARVPTRHRPKSSLQYLIYWADHPALSVSNRNVRRRRRIGGL